MENENQKNSFLKNAHQGSIYLIKSSEKYIYCLVLQFKITIECFNVFKM